MINIYEVNETNNMIEREKLDVRTITLDINLLDCVGNNLDQINENIYHKITTLAKDLVTTGRGIECDFGTPIVNKRISITPISLVRGAACECPEGFVIIARTLDKAAEGVGVNFISGYSALISKDVTATGRNLILSIPRALTETERICSSINVGSAKTGLNMDTVGLMGKIVKETVGATRDSNSLSCAKLVVFYNVPDDNFFMVEAFHGVTEADAIIDVGVSSSGVMKAALGKARGENFEALCEAIKEAAFKITRVGQLVAQEAPRRMGIPFGITDLSLAFTPSVGNSVTEILEGIGPERVRTPGTTIALTTFNGQVKKSGVMTSSYMDGSSGTFIPVSEDQGMIDAMSLGAPTLEELEAMTYVYSVGLDVIAISGDTPSTTIAGIIADEAAIGIINQRITAVRLIPVIGRKVEDTAELGGLLDYAPIILINMFSCEKFVTRGGRIPAPIHSFKD